MNEKTVEVELKFRPTVTAILSTPAPESKPLYKVEFKRLKSNQLSKIWIDWNKDFEQAKAQVLNAVVLFERLTEEVEEVSLEEIAKEEIYQELTNSILNAFAQTLTKSIEGDVDPKKESADTGSVPA